MSLFPPSLARRGGGEAFPSDRRAEARCWLKQELLGRLSTSDDGPALWARVQDISSGGLGLLVNCRLDAGTRFTLELMKGRTHLRLTLQGQVKHITEVLPGVYALGGALTNRIDSANLKALTT